MGLQNEFSFFRHFFCFLNNFTAVCIHKCRYESVSFVFYKLHEYYPPSTCCWCFLFNGCNIFVNIFLNLLENMFPSHLFADNLLSVDLSCFSNDSLKYYFNEPTKDIIVFLVLWLDRYWDSTLSKWLCRQWKCNK